MFGKTEFFECTCAADEHTIKFGLTTDDPEFVELYLSVFLNQYHGFFGRLWIAIKYLFGYKCRDGHFDCTMLKLKDADRLIALLEDFKTLASYKYGN